MSEITIEDEDGDRVTFTVDSEGTMMLIAESREGYCLMTRTTLEEFERKVQDVRDKHEGIKEIVSSLEDGT